MAGVDTLLKQARRALDRGQHAAAAAFVEQALAREPGRPDLLLMLGALREALGDREGAERCYRSLLERDDANVPALAHLAHLLFSNRRFADAVPVYAALVARAPDAPAEIWNNYGVAQQQMRDRGAEASFVNALARAPESAPVLANLGFLRVGQQRYEEAREPLERAHACDPSRLQVLAQCIELQLAFADWREFEPRREALLSALANAPEGQVVGPFALMAICDDPALQQTAARSFAWPALPVEPLAGAHERLRIGFAATAFHEHPVQRAVAALIERLDRTRFAVYAYELDASVDDAARARIVRAADGFRSLGALGAEAAAQRIAADDIDVLLDLSGHTAAARPEILARRPARRLVNFLGFAGTMGVSYYDAAIADAIAGPPALEPFFDERLARLDGCYFPGEAVRPMAGEIGRDDYGLPAQALVLATQAAPTKIVPEMFAVWMQLLRSTADAVLWLRPMHAIAQRNLRASATAHGIDERRIVFAPQEPLPRYLARHRLADVYLDTFPFGSHTTVNDALYAGVPVVSRAGRSMASRASASQLHAAGLGELIADSFEDYAAIVGALATDRARLETLTADWRARAAGSPLFDADAYARRFGALLETLV
jgi:predicted O-linked N-acetylglucosamine transferase (SPINDLY family)